MNKVILCGRLTKDPDIRYTQGDQPMAIARYNIAVDRRGKNNEADFISCIAFGKNAEFAEKYLQKGVKMLFVGHIQTGSYTNKEGTKVYTTDVVIDEQEFVESKKTSSEKPQANDDDFMQIPDDAEGDGLPFN